VLDVAPGVVRAPTPIAGGARSEAQFTELLLRLTFDDEVLEWVPMH